MYMNLQRHGFRVPSRSEQIFDSLGNITLPNSQAERRMHERFRIDTPLRWKSEGSIAGSIGQVCEMSSTSLRFVSPAPPKADAIVHLAIDWPVLLNGCRLLQLKVIGRVLRADSRGVAVKILHYEFWTRSTPPPLQVADLDKETPSMSTDV
jgi:hypothetical protein